MTRPKVLIVDDERLNITVLADLLHGDYEIVVAKSGAQAIDRVFTDAPPDLIMLDVIMPDIDGYQVCQAIKAEKKFRHIPIIFITALSSEEDEIKGFEVGGADFVTKPFRPVTIQARVKNHLELKRRGDLLERLSMLDGLTGIANRRRFDEYLRCEWNAAQRAQRPLSLVLMDVDFFKPFNDHYGHVAGDDCLKSIASTLEGARRRSTDLVARYGGEEFVAILSQTDAQGASIIAQKMLDSVRDLHIPHTRSQVANFVTISIGATTVIPKKILTIRSVLQMADQCLYQAKARGRNRIVTQDDSVKNSSGVERTQNSTG